MGVLNTGAATFSHSSWFYLSNIKSECETNPLQENKCNDSLLIMEGIARMAGDALLLEEETMGDCNSKFYRNLSTRFGDELC
jgi:hypothetical protein